MSIEHWVAHAQTPVNANTVIDDPTMDRPGTLGEIETLPYVVPEGRILIIRKQGIEGTKTPNAALFPWIGPDFPLNCTSAQKSAHRIEKALFTVQSNGGSKVHDVLWILPAGTRLHIAITNGTGALTTLAWFIRGFLILDNEDPIEAVRGL